MDKYFRIMVKLADMPRAMGLGSDGYLVNKKLFMLMFEKDKAEKAAEQIRSDFPDAVVRVESF